LGGSVRELREPGTAHVLPHAQPDADAHVLLPLSLGEPHHVDAQRPGTYDRRGGAAGLLLGPGHRAHDHAPGHDDASGGGAG
ncbi:hypothetical protein, partial [Streptomyces venezuelae]|uniref:hypothetical protein n=1 Tax=Streptomyces venezuelae TaxID=54571 RepID=UPI001F2D4C85